MQSAKVEIPARGRAGWGAGQNGESAHRGQRVSAKDALPDKDAHPTRIRLLLTPPKSARRAEMSRVTGWTTNWPAQLNMRGPSIKP